ncbi:dihydropteroate synthase [Pseudoroseicyclus tamaricis]|uniref:Dihydropteroate synthase n=1 Tax=Pseudoroseicyclus tamaricis TaxID=2705421 RepID=A0A6B2JP89_9RHOB|nr:dihydropteroate synthase [Pseudoroseicyclus tamaricis]NDU99809.1 dihydropteroate synthase [Pseudoroseicyclus tamaricis]
MRRAPLPRTGRAPEGALPLAGLDGLWFDEVQEWDGARRPATELGPEERARLTGLRADVCGLSLDRPRLMGILNVTPDSFSDGGRHATLETALARAREMAGEVDILDIGGESTRPGAEEVSRAEEIARTAPVIRAIREAGIATPISIDTRKAEVAAAALEAGADMVNDVSAFRFDAEMPAVVAEAGCPVCLMHSVADPATMQGQAQYEDVVAEVFDHLAERIALAESHGIPRGRIIADPGIGFGKTLQHNLKLLAHLPLYHDLGTALLLGASRKRFIGTIGEAPEAEDRLGGSLAVALAGARAGVQIIRVHDTRQTQQGLRLQTALIEAETW